MTSRLGCAVTETGRGLFDVALQHHQELLQPLSALRWRVGLLDAMLHVGMNQILRKRLECLSRGDQLHQNFRTVAIRVEHPFDGVQLTDDPAHSELLCVALSERMAVLFHLAHTIAPIQKEFNPCPA